MIVTVYLWIDSDISIIKFSVHSTFVFYLPEDDHVFDQNMQWS